MEKLEEIKSGGYFGSSGSKQFYTWLHVAPRFSGNLDRPGYTYLFKEM
jgi:hypothetical protein